MMGVIMVPSEWRIRIARKGDEYLLDYLEVLEKPEDMTEEEFKQAIDFTIGLKSKLPSPLQERLQVHVGEREIGFTFRGLLADIATAMVVEFLPLSRMADMTLRELFFRYLMLWAMGGGGSEGRGEA